MDNSYIIRALLYIYCKNLEGINSGKIKGLRLKQLIDYNRMIQKTGDMIYHDQIVDFNDTLIKEGFDEYKKL